jgi:hypothetical protein
VLNLVHELEKLGGKPLGARAGILYQDSAGQLLVTVLGMVAELERRFILERQAAGIASGPAYIAPRRGYLNRQAFDLPEVLSAPQSTTRGLSPIMSMPCALIDHSNLHRGDRPRPRSLWDPWPSRG